MFLKIFLFILGFIITGISISFIIIYLNLLTIGYNFREFVYFISRRIECLSIILGIVFMIISLKGDNNELRI